MKNYASLVSMMTPPSKSGGGALDQRVVPERGLNPIAKGSVPSEGRSSQGLSASPTKDDDARISRYRGSIIRRYGAPSFGEEATASMAPVVQPATGTSVAAAATAVSAALDAGIAKASASELTEEGPSAADPALVGGLMANGQTERRVVKEAAPAGVGDVAASAAGWAALADISSSAPVTMAVAQTPLVVTTMGEPASGWAILAEGRTLSEPAEVKMAVEAEESKEASPSGGGRGWNVRVGVILTIGAGVAVGAAFWARRR